MAGSIRPKSPRHSRKGAVSRSKAKELLREDFNHCCGYCGDDDYHAGKETYHADHFAPKSRFPELKDEYTNKVYSCPYCNRSKGDKWVSDSASLCVVGDIGFVNPVCDSYEAHFRRSADGSIIPVDALGEYMHRELNLGLLRHRCLYGMSQIEHVVDSLERFIDSLEDNDLRKPNLNSALQKCKVLFYDYYQMMRSERG